MLINIWKSDLYRLGKSRLFYGVIFFTALTAILLITMIHHEIRLGISIIGEPTVFRNFNDVILNGITYYKGLGILAAILISIFIGQEYQWQTWQHKHISNPSRIRIYLSKALLSALLSAAIFLFFEITVLLGSGKIPELATGRYAVLIICGVFIYAGLGCIFCFFSMLLKSNTASIIVCLSYILFSETFVSLLKNIGSFSERTSGLTTAIIRHSFYGMTSRLYTSPASVEMLIFVFINTLIITMLYTVTGAFLFRKYEL